jgi:hypothetical protein
MRVLAFCHEDFPGAATSPAYRLSSFFLLSHIKKKWAPVSFPGAHSVPQSTLSVFLPGK